ncbi:uncharacterized protein V1510DRAFT_4404 [Dipodascopsis tothii]|uniref:uncharacterized protein n=1 Tax=Dipodascopsis tothii TaxID=44089 RepID=UPI0034CFEEAB
MAPSTAASSQKRLLDMVKTLQFSWFAGHVLVLLGVLFYLISTIKFSTNTAWARFWYRESFFSVIITYSIVLFRTYKSSSPTTTTLLRDDNVQYLAIALLWLFSRPLLITLPSFAIYSFFHVLTYSRSVLLPALGHGASSPLSTRIQSFVDTNNDKFTSVVANLELLLLARLAVNAITFQKGSWVTVLIYGAFMHFRYEQSVFTKFAVRNWEVRIDGLVAHPSVPAPVRLGWIRLKQIVASLSSTRTASVPTGAKAR